MKIEILLSLCVFILSINAYPLYKTTANDEDQLKLNVMISAKTRSLEVYVRNARLIEGDQILITNNEPLGFIKTITTSIHNDINEDSNVEGDDNEINGNEEELKKTIGWTESSGRNIEILGVFDPKEKHEWIRTDLKFNYDESNKIDRTTKCYSHWVSYVDTDGNIISMDCVRAYPTWMNDMRDDLKNLSMKEIFLPGTHDSGSYRPNFNPSKDETLISRFALTQDDNIKAQLMHGIRYLDIRMGYYTLSVEKFYIVHGISRQRPLREALEQLKEFVMETNEIVIFDVRQFENGFQDIKRHHQLIDFIKSYIGDYLVDATQSWGITLEQIWQSGKNIILTYGDHEIRNEYPEVLFDVINHRWGNKDDWPSLEAYLRSQHGKFLSSPNSDMAELTPNAMGIITGKYGGLRQLADDVNSKVSELYLNKLGQTTNILSVDFYRGTLVTELAIHFNKLRRN